MVCQFRPLMGTAPAPNPALWVDGWINGYMLAVTVGDGRSCSCAEVRRLVATAAAANTNTSGIVAAAGGTKRLSTQGELLLSLAQGCC